MLSAQLLGDGQHPHQPAKVKDTCLVSLQDSTSSRNFLNKNNKYIHSYYVAGTHNIIIIIVKVSLLS